jgi:hypothetical protein
MKEFVEGVHFTKEEKRLDNVRYLMYLKNKHQSKAFPVGIVIGSLAVGIFLKSNRSNPSYNKFAKFVYSINLFICVHTFVYEIWSKMYTDKETLAFIDNKILSINK